MSVKCISFRTNGKAAGPSYIMGRSREPPTNTCLLLSHAMFQRRAFNLGRAKAAPLEVSFLFYIYSLNTMAGSIFVARNAGTRQAKHPVTPNTMIAVANVSRSAGETP